VKSRLVLEPPELAESSFIEIAKVERNPSAIAFGRRSILSESGPIAKYKRTISKILLTNQYSTSPAGKVTPQNNIMNGMMTVVIRDIAAC
jgi:hypothetical protein